MKPELDHHSTFAVGPPTVIDVLDRDENRRKASGGRASGCADDAAKTSRATAAGAVANGARHPRPRRTAKAAAPPRRDPFYTRDEIAAHCLARARRYFDFKACLLVEPSAGGGAFSRQMPGNTVAVDVEPAHAGILKADYLAIEFRCTRPIVTVGNPPFGKNAGLARRFFNHAARQSDGIAMIFPRSFRKAAIENCLDQNFHLVWEEDVPPDAFVFGGEPRDVGAVFQIWERRRKPRRLKSEEWTHPDFTFVEPSLADFTIRRVGVNAGDIGHDLSVKKSTHYGIKGDAVTSARVKAVMAGLDLKTPAANATATRSLAKSEIVRLYRAANGSPARARGGAGPAAAARRRPAARQPAAIASPIVDLPISRSR